MRKISARECEVRKIPQKEAQDFVDLNHSQGSVQIRNIISFGLVKDNELLGLVQFCVPRTSLKKRQYSRELVRLAFKTNVRVRGGASKLVTYYRRNYNPSDIFTYQDTTGENGRVYEECGFRLVKQEKKKVYLVAPGKSLATATKKEALGIAYATRYGPDRILGTKLGELHHDNGIRKSNIEIFTNELGWRKEETSGDKIYEWVNEDITFYTYKTTAIDSEKYYYGVSHVKKRDASIKDCLNDGYYGSGAEKFLNWKKKHLTTLQKEVLSTFKRKAPAFEYERKLVGDKWFTDPLCLNTIQGGVTTHSRKKISYPLMKCSVHGETKHYRGTKECIKCSSSNLFTLESCVIHGETTHRKNVCTKCASSKAIKNKNCFEHGDVPHIGDSCFKCVAKHSKVVKKCNIHGKTKHIGNACYKCTVGKTLHKKTCAIHGETLYQGNECPKCATKRRVLKKVCAIHGETSHYGDNCLNCAQKKAHKLQECEIHGKVYHQAGVCTKCINISRVIMKTCPIHGETKHQGEHCRKCFLENRWSMKICPIHGETKHIVNTCYQCSSEKIVSKKECPKHGNVKFQGNKCSSCTNEKLIGFKNCEYHGETKHRGKTCYKCMGERRKHKNHFEKETSCRICME